ncbi:hypothetical protein Ct61P_15105 [Colletotrichum tofieldiae]|nr:hypothetical protein Ct61P_15105 [Colletotrichum tofieldiae]
MLMVMEDVVEPISFGGPVEPPAALDRLVGRIEDSVSGIAIISHAVEQSVPEEADRNRSQFRWVRQRPFAPRADTSSSPSRDELDPTPSVSEVNPIWSNVDDCYHFQHFENQWNCVVHSQILLVTFKHSGNLGYCSL